MGEALLFGILGSSALVLGGVLGAKWEAPTQVSGVLLAFASGTLLSALSFELFPEAVHLGGLFPAAAGLLAGGATFVVVNTWLDSRVARQAGDPDNVLAPDGISGELSGAEAEQSEKIRDAASGNVAGAVAFALLAAVTLDGVPENLAMGVSLVSDEAAAEGGGGGTLALLVAIFASNFPESLVGAVAMKAAGRSDKFAIGVWSAAAVLLAAAVVFGYSIFSGVGETSLAFAMAFAGGAVLASLADTLMPEAFEHGRPFNSFATAAGFFVAFVLATI
ncbi:MAG: zinc permease [Actinomycetota bacterium]|nr:zinc permease [Actinomycetota bacterium]